MKTGIARIGASRNSTLARVERAVRFGKHDACRPNRRVREYHPISRSSLWPAEGAVTMVNPYAGKVRAPEFPADLTWFNSRPLTLRELRGKLVVLDFWTYC
jgi:hypothetical protein